MKAEEEQELRKAYRLLYLGEINEGMAIIGKLLEDQPNRCWHIPEDEE